MLLFPAEDETPRHSYPPRVARPAESHSQRQSCFDFNETPLYETQSVLMLTGETQAYPPRVAQ